MKKILITGGAGFIGSQLGANLVREGYDVILLDNMSDGYEDNLIVNGKRFDSFVQMDVRDKNLTSIVDGVDTIFHFAATSALPKCQSDAVAAYDNNVTGVAHVLEAARKKGVRRVIFSSTSAVYENSKDAVFTESSPVSPDLVYSSTKYAGELMCKGFASTYGLDIIVARFFNVYGEHQDIHRPMPPFVGYLAREFFYGRSPTLFNKTDVKRDYVYYGDVLNCLKSMMNATKHYSADVFNICSGIGYSVPDIVSIYAMISGKKIEPTFSDPTRFWDKFPEIYEGKFPFKRERTTKEVFKNSIGSPLKTESEFGFRAQVSFEDGLRSVHRFCDEQFSKGSK